MGVFHHSRLEVYRLAVRFAGEVDPILRRVPRWRAPVRDQLLRATCSILANIAEGTGEHSPRDKARFYRIARRSAAECAALLDLLFVSEVAAPGEVHAAHQLLARIAALLTVMAKRLETQPSSGGAAAAEPSASAGRAEPRRAARRAGAQGPLSGPGAQRAPAARAAPPTP